MFFSVRWGGGDVGGGGSGEEGEEGEVKVLFGTFGLVLFRLPFVLEAKRMANAEVCLVFTFSRCFQQRFPRPHAGHLDFTCNLLEVFLSSTFNSPL